MAVEVPKISYSGKIKAIPLGDPAKNLMAGGDEAYSFYTFEGAFPNPTRIAMEVWDTPPEDWAEALKAPTGWIPTRRRFARVSKKVSSPQEYIPQSMIWLVATDITSNPAACKASALLELPTNSQVETHPIGSTASLMVALKEPTVISAPARM